MNVTDALSLKLGDLDEVSWPEARWDTNDLITATDDTSFTSEEVCMCILSGGYRRKKAFKSSASGLC